MLTLTDDWEFNVLGIYNYKVSGPFDALFNFIRNHHADIEGDIVECGVYRGKSLIALAMLLKELGSDKKIYGYDSFSGFPSVYHHNDDLARFDDLQKKGRITPDHFQAVQRNLSWREQLSDQGQTAKTISSSGDFSATSLEYVQRKIKIVGLDNIVLRDGPFDETMKNVDNNPTKIMAALMDCDLYQSYMDCFEFIWPRLSDSGIIYLDEYYSLKFPGARIATDEFIAGKEASLMQYPQKQGDFERWYLQKDKA
jgi:hypothetical protein